MASVCGQCKLTLSAGARVPKVLPCGHIVCLSCLQKHTRNRGRLCPFCGKVFKEDPKVLADDMASLEQELWCVDCNVAARAPCSASHLLRPTRVLRQEAADALVAARAGRAAALRALARDVQREQRELDAEEQLQMPGQQLQMSLPALMAALATATAHPLQLLHQQFQDGDCGRGGGGSLLRRALRTLQQQQQQQGRQPAAEDVQEVVALLDQEVPLLPPPPPAVLAAAWREREAATLRSQKTAAVPQAKALAVPEESTTTTPLRSEDNHDAVQGDVEEAEREGNEVAVMQTREAVEVGREAAVKQMEAALKQGEAVEGGKEAALMQMKATLKQRLTTEEAQESAKKQREAALKLEAVDEGEEAALNETEAVEGGKKGAALKQTEAALMQWETVEGWRGAVLRQRKADGKAALEQRGWGSPDPHQEEQGPSLVFAFVPKQELEMHPAQSSIVDDHYRENGLPPQDDESKDESFSSPSATSCGSRQTAASPPATPATPPAAAAARASSVGLSDLPDEALCAVLAALSPPSASAEEAARALLPLRLVCQRWARLALSRPVWRRRDHALFARGARAGLLRLVPALDTLTVHAKESRAEEILQPAIEGVCQFRALHCSLYGTRNSGAALATLFGLLRFSLRELTLDVVGSLWGAVEALDELRSLERLTFVGDFHHDVFLFRRLATLRELRLAASMRAGVVESLLQSSREALRRVDCGGHRVAALLALCPALRDAVVPLAADLKLLQRVPDLHALTVECSDGDDDLGGLEALLRHPRLRAAVVVRLVYTAPLSDAAVRALAVAAPDLRRVRVLDLAASWRHCGEAPAPARLLAGVAAMWDGVAAMPDLEVLRVRCAAFAEAAVCLTGAAVEGGARRLRVLHVDADDRGLWEEGLRAAWPGLTVCREGCALSHH